MVNEIGENAGKVWMHLKNNGKCTPKKLVEATGVKERDLQRAIGWLARENKIGFEVSGKLEVLYLLEQ